MMDTARSVKELQNKTMAQLERKHLSRLVPVGHRVLMPLLLAVTIVNSAVGFD